MTAVIRPSPSELPDELDPVSREDSVEAQTGMVEEPESADEWTTDLLDQSAGDPGAPFRPDALKRLVALKRDDQARFESLRAQLKEHRVRVTELDRALKKVSEGDEEGTGPHKRLLKLPDPEPWPETVDGAELLDDIKCVIRRYLATDDHAAEAMALWALHAHALDAAQISPRLAFASPEKRCGKTTALSIMQQLVPRPLPASNITAAPLFRAVEEARPTVLIDEADTFIRDNDELRGILNSGHSRSNAYVIRTVGQYYDPAMFHTWAAVAIAMIGRLPDTLEDRAVVIEMRRKRPSDRVARFRSDRVDDLALLNRKAASWASDNMIGLQAWDGDVPAGLHDRAADNWRPLLAIADLVGRGWSEHARAAATALSRADTDEQSSGVMLLADIHAIFTEAGVDRMPSEVLLGRLNRMEHRPWPEWKQGKPLTARQIARLLQPFGITPKSVRLDDGSTPKGYLRLAFDDAFSRYLPLQSATPPQPAEPLGFEDFQSATEPCAVADEKSPKPKEINACGGVADKYPEPCEDMTPPGCAYCGGAHSTDNPVLHCQVGDRHQWLHRECEEPWLKGSERQESALGG